jgi:hypothetical protein
MAVTDVLLVGVDGGATEVKAHAVVCDDLEQARSFALRPESASRVYQPLPDFVPVPVSEQLAQRGADRIILTPQETDQGRLWVRAAAQAIAEVARQCAASRVLVGMGMPGLKTPDGRGVNVINNGPRIPDYLKALEKELAAAGVELASRVAALGSDADYCGLGEEYAAGGLFRDVASAYYVGCGTGIADAMKLRGKLVAFDQARSWIQKSWQMPSALGPTFEKLISAAAVNRVYADLVEGTKEVAAGAPAGRKSAAALRYPEVAAAAGDPVAAAWMDTAALVLAELIFERLWTIKNGRADAPHRGEVYAKLSPDHEYRGVLLDRVIIGQRVGQVYADPAYCGVFGDKVDAYLAAFVGGSDDTEMYAAYLTDTNGGEQRHGGTKARRREGVEEARSAGPPSPARLKSRFVQASKLRAAPALGAAVAAVQALRAAR